MTRVLEAKAVHFGYEPGTDVLCGVDATIRGGALSAIVGPNGSGKSTFLRMLCGLLRPREGAVSLDGCALHSFSSRARARMIAFLPQSVSPAFSLSVFEVVCLGRYPHTGAMGSLRAADLEVARRCSRDTETEDLADRDFMSLSGGERQRVLLASILAQEPDILLLDEPTSALDIHHETEVLDLLKRLKEEGYGIAVVTHDLNLAAQYCDEMVLLSAEHSVQASGAPDAVLTAEELTRAYGATISVGTHPFTGTPFAAARPEAGREESS